MLKTTESSDKLALGKNDNSRSASNRNKNSRPAFGRNNGNSEVNRFGIGGDGMEHAKKSGKLNSKKSAKSRKLFKSKKSKGEKSKKLLKSRNSLNFGTIETGPNFLTPGARKTFNRLRLAFTKAPVF